MCVLEFKRGDGQKIAMENVQVGAEVSVRADVAHVWPYASEVTETYCRGEDAGRGGAWG